MRKNEVMSEEQRELRRGKTGVRGINPANKKKEPKGVKFSKDVFKVAGKHLKELKEENE